MVYMLIGVMTFVLLMGTDAHTDNNDKVNFLFIKQTKSLLPWEYEAIYVVDGGVVYQNITVTDTEEIFTTDEATIIADFSTGLITTHFKKLEMYADICYILNLNFNDSQTPNEFKNTHTNIQITFIEANVVTVTYAVTDIWLHPRALGQRSAQLCEGKIPLFLREKKDETARLKRFDPEDDATTYKATRDAYLKSANELKLATGPYKAARDAYVAAIATYTKSLNWQLDLIKQLGMLMSPQ